MRIRSRWVMGSLVLSGLAIGATTAVAMSSFRPASSGSEPYVIEDISLQYPGIDENHAGVTFAYRWSGSTYPGPASCRITLEDATGTSVGLVEVDVDSLQSGAANAVVPSSRVEVEGEPIKATAACEAASTTDAPGVYSLEDPQLYRDELGVVLKGEVHWNGEGVPVTQQCTLAVSVASREVTFGFTLNAPDGFIIEVGLPDEFETGINPGVTCESYSTPSPQAGVEED